MLHRFFIHSCFATFDQATCPTLVPVGLVYRAVVSRRAASFTHVLTVPADGPLRLIGREGVGRMEGMTVNLKCSDLIDFGAYLKKAGASGVFESIEP